MAVAKNQWRRPSNHIKERIQKDMATGLRLGFRSGLEVANAELLERLGVKVEYETMKIPYVVPESRHKYTPDFPLPNGVLVETKGKLEQKDRVKHLLIRAQHPDLDIRFVFQRPHDPIVKGSKTTYAMWADKHSLKWATKMIPLDWIKEPGPDRKPKEVLGL